MQGLVREIVRHVELAMYKGYRMRSEKGTSCTHMSAIWVYIRVTHRVTHMGIY